MPKIEIEPISFQDKPEQKKTGFQIPEKNSECFLMCENCHQIVQDLKDVEVLAVFGFKKVPKKWCIDCIDFHNKIAKKKYERLIYKKLQ